MQTLITKKSLLLLTIALVTNTVWAEWVKVAGTAGPTGIEIYIDPTTIRADGSLRKVWAIQDFKQRDKDGGMSTRSRLEFDCKQERYVMLSLSRHSETMASGTVMFDKSLSAVDWIEVPPRSAIAAMLKKVCAQ